MLDPGPEAARDLAAATAAGAREASIADLPAMSAALAVPRSSTASHEWGAETSADTSSDFAAILQANGDSIAPTADRKESKANPDTVPPPRVRPT